MAEEKNIIEVGSVSFTDLGEWKKGYSFVDEDTQATVVGYDEGDIVHTSSGVYASLEDGNTTDPDSEEGAGKWRMWIDMAPVNTAVADATAAKKTALSAANAANRAASSASAVAKTAEEKASLADKSALQAQQQADGAQQAATAATATITRMETLAANVTSMAIGTPTRMDVAVPTDISTHNKVAQRIKVSLFPAYLPQSVLYQVAEGSSVTSDPSGNLTVKDVGATRFYVIPTANTPLWQEVSITVRQPRLRLSAQGKLRLSASGKMRIV